jgi:hypothetical protein
MRAFLRMASCLLAAALIACDDAPLTPPVGAPGVRPVLGANVTDTVDALLAQALVVEVRNLDGRLASGVVIRFNAEPPRDTTRRTEPALFVCSLSAPTCGPATPSGFWVCHRHDGCRWACENSCPTWACRRSGRAQVVCTGIWSNRFGDVYGPTGRSGAGTGCCTGHFA